MAEVLPAADGAERANGTAANGAGLGVSRKLGLADPHRAWTLPENAEVFCFLLSQDFSCEQSFMNSITFAYGHRERGPLKRMWQSAPSILPLGSFWPSTITTGVPGGHSLLPGAPACRCGRCRV